jgi:cytoskeleton protein RodZ
MKINATPHPTTQADYYTDIAVGEILRRTRVHYNQTLDDVSAYLRIRASQLEAIEKGDLSQLPGRVYVIGYIRTYAEYLGLDGEKMVAVFKQQAGGKNNKPELHFPVPASESKAPNLYIIFGSLAVLALVIGVWIALSIAGNKSRNKDIAEIPSVPAEMRVVQAPAPVAPVTASVTPTESAGAIQTQMTPAAAPGATATMQPQQTSVMNQPQQTQSNPSNSIAAIPAATEAAPPVITPTAPVTQTVQTAPAAVAKKEIVITIRDRSWVEVRDKEGKPLLSRILKPGEVFIVPESNYGLRLDTGNAGGIDLTVNGQPYPPLGKQGDILRGFVLDGNKMMEKYQASASAMSKVQ